MSGKAIYHSMNKLAAQKLGSTPEYSGIDVEIVDQGALLKDFAAATLAKGPLETASCGMSGGCTFGLTGVDVSSASVGLVARLVDTRTTAALWITTETGILNAADLAALQASKGLFTDGRAFAVSRDAIDAVVAPLVGLTGDEVMARGFVFGLIYSSVSADGSGQPVIGATVKANGAALTIVYPNNMFSGTVAATASQGAFLAVPSAAGAAASVTFTITPPAGQPSLKWDAARAAVVRPGAAYFQTMYPE